jgi:hypothetical protein
VQVFELSFLGNFYLWNNASTGIGWPLPANQTFYDYENIWSSFPLGKNLPYSLFISQDFMALWL